MADGRGPVYLSPDVATCDECLDELLDPNDRLFAIRPSILAHDLHPDYASSRYARQRSRREGIELLNIQHHHAHLASCMAENGLQESVIGVTFDGTGFETDGVI